MYSDYFELSKKSPSGIVWKVNKGRAKAGEPAITAIGNGYYKGRLNQKTVYAHRIVFALHYGFEPDIVDHIDGNTLNNDPENLRNGSKALNNQNRVVSGCSWHERDQVYYASICKGGVRYHLGAHKTRESAESAYISAKSKLHEFANIERYKKC